MRFFDMLRWAIEYKVSTVEGRILILLFSMFKLRSSRNFPMLSGRTSKLDDDRSNEVSIRSSERILDGIFPFATKQKYNTGQNKSGLNTHLRF